MRQKFLFSNAATILGLAVLLSPIKCNAQMDKEYQEKQNQYQSKLEECIQYANQAQFVASGGTRHYLIDGNGKIFEIYYLPQVNECNWSFTGLTLNREKKGKTKNHPDELIKKENVRHDLSFNRPDKKDCITVLYRYIRISGNVTRNTVATQKNPEPHACGS